MRLSVPVARWHGMRQTARMLRWSVLRAARSAKSLDPALATVETLATVREGELRCAADALGIRELIFLDYRDSGMIGTPENDDERAFIRVDAAEVVPRLVGMIRRIKPQVVLTFDPQGGYGHPDHIAIHTHTVAAVKAAGDAAQFPEEGEPWQSSRLFYVVISRGTFLRMRDRMKEAGLDTTRFDQFEESGVGWPDENIDATIDVSATVDAKWRSLQCHATQFGKDNPFQQLPEAVMKQLFSREHFALAWPERASRQSWSDLFEGLE